MDVSRLLDPRVRVGGKGIEVDQSLDFVSRHLVHKGVRPWHKQGFEWERHILADVEDAEVQVFGGLIDLEGWGLHSDQDVASTNAVGRIGLEAKTEGLADGVEGTLLVCVCLCVRMLGSGVTSMRMEISASIQSGRSPTLITQLRWLACSPLGGLIAGQTWS
jgi:hypothetical protein